MLPPPEPHATAAARDVNAIANSTLLESKVKSSFLKPVVFDGDLLRILTLMLQESCCRIVKESKSR
jgi:hypothetical protein